MYASQIRKKPMRNNSCRYRCSAGFQNKVNPKERLMNNQKRQKLRSLLIARFTKKYNIQPDLSYIIDNEITKFLQQEKLNDVDLQRLDDKIKNIISENKAKTTLKNNLTNTLQSTVQPQIPKMEEESIYPKNYQPPQKSIPPRAISQSQIRPKTSKNKKIYKNPEEELADLEKELAEIEEREARESGYYFYNDYQNKLKRIDFSSKGNEWAAMAEYDRRLYEQQLKNERIMDRKKKQQTKEDLDFQVKEKVKKEYEDELKEKEYDKMFKEHQKKLDAIEKEKAALIKQQYLREKASREAQQKDEYVRKRIETLKEKKNDKEILHNVKLQLEEEQKTAIEQKRKRNEALNKGLKENELNREIEKKNKEIERLNDLKFLEEHENMDKRADQEREYLLNKIKNRSNRYSSKEQQNILNKIKEDQEEEDRRTLYYMNEKTRKADEKERKEKIRIENEKKYLKSYYDMQVEEKRKHNELDKLLDGEQARIWKRDCDKYNEDEKRIAGIIYAKNRRNLESIQQQMKEKKNKESRMNMMSDVEYAMNRAKLEKAQEIL